MTIAGSAGRVALDFDESFIFSADVGESLSCWVCGAEFSFSHAADGADAGFFESPGGG